MHTLSASVVSADLGNLERELGRLAAAGVHRVHVDVEDGVFVPNLTFGFPVLRAVRRLTALPVEAHLMVAHPEPYLEAFAAAADVLMVHFEACPYPRRVLARIRALGRRAFLAANPRTSLADMAYLADLLDGVLIMSSEPDAVGDPFLPAAYSRVEQVRRLLGGGLEVMADGGIGVEEARELRRRGASGVVVGRALFGAPDLAAAVRDLCG